MLCPHDAQFDRCIFEQAMYFKSIEANDLVDYYGYQIISITKMDPGHSKCIKNGSVS